MGFIGDKSKSHQAFSPCDSGRPQDGRVKTAGTAGNPREAARQALSKPKMRYQDIVIKRKTALASRTPPNVYTRPHLAKSQAGPGCESFVNATYEINMFRDSLETVDNSASLGDQPRPAERYPDGIVSSNNEYSEKVNSLR